MKINNNSLVNFKKFFHILDFNKNMLLGISCFFSKNIKFKLFYEELVINNDNLNSWDFNQNFYKIIQNVGLFYKLYSIMFVRRLWNVKCPLFVKYKFFSDKSFKQKNLLPRFYKRNIMTIEFFK